MHKRITTFFGIALLFFTQLSALVFKSDTITAITPYVHEGSLVIFDLDDTLIKTPELIGSDTWFTFLTEEQTKKGLTYNEAVEQVLPLYFFVRNIVHVELVEPCAPAFIAHLRQQNIQVMALTSQSLPLIAKTTKEMDRLGIHFFITEASNNIFGLSITHNAKFVNGILFSGNNHKGDTLFQLLDLINAAPSNIIFIDDKESNVKKVESAVEAHGISFIGLHFTGADTWKNEFNQTLANKQLYAFKVNYGLAPRTEDAHPLAKKELTNE